MSAGGPRPLEGRRIQFLFDSLEMGGSERQALHLAKWLHEEGGARVRLLARVSDGPVREQAEALGISCAAAPWPRPRRTFASWRARRSYARARRKEGVDVWLPITVEPCVVSALIWRATGAKACVWRQADAGISLRDKAIQRRALDAASHRVANAPAARDALVRVHGIDPDRVEIIPNAVAPAAPRDDEATWRARLGLGPDQPLIVMVGNLTPFKDHATLLDAFARVSTEGPLPVLALAGREESTAAGLHEQAERLAIADRVRFLGFQGDVSGLIATSTCCVLSSRQEGCPNGVLEPMALGRAVAGTDIEGVRFALGPDSDALLAPVGDAARLATVLENLLRDAEGRAAWAARGQARIASHFSLAAYGAAWTTLIARALGASS